MTDLFYALILGYFFLELSCLLKLGSRDRFPVVSLGIFSVATDGTMFPGVDSASEIEYQGFVLG